MFNKNSTSCPICHNPKKRRNKYCNEHSKARQHLSIAYEKWLYAFGILSWEDFLNQIVKLKETGKLIKEVAEYELYFSEK
ncbi:MAG: hypothetical protein ACTSYD_10310 [Candidatus Heimdallarchaeaceae archaeon]